MSRSTAKLTSIVVALFAMLILAPAAGAASIAYVGADGNVHQVSPDGEQRKQLTGDATLDNKYRSPSQLNDGRVVAIRRVDGSTSFAHFLRPDGSIDTSWLMPKSGAGGFAPYTGGQASPDGGVIAYDYRHFDCGTNPCQGNQRVGFLTGPGQTNPCLVNCHIGYVAPRWLPGSPYAAMIDQSFNAVYAQKQGSAGPVGWYQYGNGITFSSFDARGGKIVDTVSLGGSDYMVIQSMNGAAPTLPSTNCSVNLPAGPDTGPRARLSPDGSMVAWATAEGIFVSPTPTQTGGIGSLCQLTPKLVAAGGSQPDWGIATLPKPNVPDPNNPDPKDPNGPKDPDGPGGDRAAPQAKVSIPLPPKLAKALGSGLTIGFTCSEECRASVQATVSAATTKKLGLGRKPATVATGTGSLAKAGQGTSKLRFTARAKSKLRNARKVALKLELTVRDSAGNDRTVGGVVTLKR